VAAKDVSASVTGSLLDGNSAEAGSGGAILMSCSMSNGKRCRFSVMANTLKNNRARENGGAIYYDLFSPEGLINNTYQLNSA
jgi:predicted outer membrane repeat protein